MKSPKHRARVQSKTELGDKGYDTKCKKFTCWQIKTKDGTVLTSCHCITKGKIIWDFYVLASSNHDGVSCLREERTEDDSK